MGDAYSVLDIYCFMLTLWGKPSEIELLQRFPNIAALTQRVRERSRLKAVLDSHGVLEPGGYGG